MKRRRRKMQFHEPSLVPLADMLTNTVGIMVFILIFTVLTAGGATLLRRLPIEHPEPDVNRQEYYYCTQGKLYPIRDDVTDEIQKIDRAKFDSFNSGDHRDDMKLYISKLGARSKSDHYLKFTMTTEYFEENRGNRIGYGAQYQCRCDPISDMGLEPWEIGREDGFFAQDLAKDSPRTTGLIFWVKPDSGNEWYGS